MARDWVRLTSYSSKEEAEKYLPEGWQVFQIEQLYEQLPVGKRFEQKTSFPVGNVPVIDQSAAGIVGWHNEEPGVLASPENPVVTFANHTCEMRLMEESFSVIQNVFPLIGRNGVCQTRFLYYLTKGRVWLEEYKGHFPDFRRKWVYCPPYKEQEQLVKVFGDLDDKIDLNRRINQTLEAMAQAIFKSWFVDFDPVKAKIVAKQEGRDPLRAAMSAISGKLDADLDAMQPEQFGQLAATAALFPDEMEESELGEIPRGWSAKKFGDFIDRMSVGKKFDQKTAFAEGAVPILDQGKSGIIGFHNDPPGVCASLEKPVVVFANHTCYMRLITFDFSAIQNVLPFVGKDVDTVWAYYATKGTVKFSEYKGHWPDFVLADAVVPQSDLTVHFRKILQPLISQMRILELKSEKLATLRDTLLPKLLSGELSVSELDSNPSEASP